MRIRLLTGILKDGFDWRRWQANAAALSHAYFTMWDQHYKNIERSYKSNDILYIRYEDLKNKTTRIAELRKVTRFLNFHVSDEKLQCAFFLAEVKFIIYNTMSYEISLIKI